MMNIIDQIKAVTDKYPSLSVTPNEDGYTLIGTITMSKTYNDVPLYDDYHLKIVVTSDFPEHIPSVFDINDDIPNDFNHFLTDGSFCLGVFCDLRSFLDAIDQQPVAGKVMREIVRYETALAYASTMLDSKYFAKINTHKSKEWEEYKKRFCKEKIS